MMTAATLTRRNLLRGIASGAIGTVAQSRFPQGGAARQTSQRTLRLAGSVFGVPSFDPALSRDLDTNFLMRQVHRGLMQFSAELEPVPALAEDVEMLDEGQRYRFTLRPGVRFSHGTKADARAVAASLARALNPAIAGGDPALLAAPTYLRDVIGADDVLAGRRDDLAGVEVESARSLVISLAAPSGTFLMRLCSVPAAIVDAGAMNQDEAAGAGPAGIGPFMVDQVEPGEKIRLVPNPHWFGEPVGPGAIELLLGAGATNPFNLFQAGDVDLVPVLRPQLAPLATDPSSGIEGDVIATPLFAMAYIALGDRTPPLDDVHLRRALALAFPVDRVATDQFQGQVKAPRGIVPQGMLGRQWDNVVLPYDPEQARAELAQSRYAGAASVPPIRIFAADTEPLLAFRAQIRKVLGLDIRVYQVPWNTFLGGLARQEYGAYSLYWGADYPDPESFLWMLFGTESAENYTGYHDARFQQVLDTARQSVQEDERAAAYLEAERLLLQHGACVPLYQNVGHTLVRHGVRNVPVTPMGVLGLESVRSEGA